MDEEGLFLKNKKKALRNGNIKLLSESLKHLGDYYYENKNFEKALEEYREWLDVCKTQKNELNISIAHRLIGEVYSDLKNFDDALEHQTLYLEGAQKLQNMSEEQRAFATLGRTYFCKAEALESTEEKLEYKEALKNAKKAYSKSIKVCDSLENSEIDPKELKLMRARLLLNLGLVYDAQSQSQEAEDLIQEAAAMCKKYSFSDDYHRTSISLAGLYEKQGKFKLALEQLDNAASIDCIYLKADALFSKANLLLKLGEFFEAKKILIKLYKEGKTKNYESLKFHIEKILKIAVKLCKLEDNLLLVDDIEKKLELYESLGDISVSVRASEKAIEYYKEMLECAKKINSNKIGPALVSVAQTLCDCGKYEEAIFYAQKEFQMCKDSKEVYKSSLFLASLYIDMKAPDSKIREMFDKALEQAKHLKDIKMEAEAISEFIDYLEKSDDINPEEIIHLKEQLKNLNDILPEEENTEEEPNSEDLASNICLEELSDLEIEEENLKATTNISNKSHKFVIKRNAVGETQLHTACIKGKIAQVEKLLQQGHPVNVRDQCGWTPLHEACNHGFLDIVDLLIKSGANINDPGGTQCGGITPLLDAASNGMLPIINLLLNHNANANLVSAKGENAIEFLDECVKKAKELTDEEFADYQVTRNRLLSVMDERVINKCLQIDKNNTDSESSDDEASKIRRTKSKNRKTGKLSATDIYKQTIEMVQHPVRMNAPIEVKKVSTPLIECRENDLQGNDWLEEDIILENKKTVFPDPFNFPNKRKSNDETNYGNIKIDSKSNKRQRRNSIEESMKSLSFSEDSSNSSCNMIEITEEVVRPKRTKKRQSKLFNSGFTKQKIRSPSPDVIDYFKPIKNFLQTDQFSKDYNGLSETINLVVSVETELIDLKLHFPRDKTKTIDSIMEIVKKKFEDLTGIAGLITFKTSDGNLLTSYSTLDLLPKEKNTIRLNGLLDNFETISIESIYKKICESCDTDFSESVLKSLKSCEFNGTYRLNPDEISEEQFYPLFKCLYYQKNLSYLYLSGGLLCDFGESLNLLFKSLSNLSQLHLQCCDISFNFLSKIEKLPVNLRVLDLGYNPLGSKSCEKLYDILKPLKNLQTLNLRSCELDRFVHKLENKSLINIDLSWNPINGVGAANLLQQQLINLNLSNTVNNIGESNVIDTIFFQGDPFYSLEVLELGSCNITDLDVEKILTQAPNITKLVLSNNKHVTLNSLYTILKKNPPMSYVNMCGCKKISEAPKSGLKLLNFQTFTLILSIDSEVVNSWKSLWEEKVLFERLPHNTTIIKFV